jgi:thiol-disulfide isomerase/thioredoxin
VVASAATEAAALENTIALIDTVVNHTKQEGEKLSSLADLLYTMLEQRSLFAANAYLTQRLLAGDDCDCLDPQIKTKLEKYKLVIQGQTAPDIVFGTNTYAPDGKVPTSLARIQAPYKVLIFAATWCPHCQLELPLIVANYNRWKAKGIEVVLVSLDTDVESFNSLATGLPFISTTDLQKWEGKAVQDFQVMGTPSYFVLDQNLKVLLRPISFDFLEEWINTQNE